MQINKITINNFRCFEHLELDLHPRLNVFVGVNGSGKTALLEALKIASGAFFLGIKSDFSPNVNILKKDIFYSKFSKNLESKPPAEILAHGKLNDVPIHWKRALQNVTKYSKTTQKDAKEISLPAMELAEKVRVNQPARLPLIAHFSTDRLCHCSTIEFDGTYGTRFRGYDRCMDANYSFEIGEWYKTQELRRLQAMRHGDKNDLPELDIVQQAITNFIPNVVDVFFDFSKNMVCLKFDDGTYQPIDTLSDGFRNLLVLVSDLTIRSLMLNPELGKNANSVAGIVLIDEVDLHLHPSWQRLVIPKLLLAFPNIQFFITTHSPMVLASLEPHIADTAPNIFLLSTQGVAPLENELFGTANNWLTEVMGLNEPRSKEAEEAMSEAKKILAEKEPSSDNIRKVSEKLMRLVQAHDTFWVRWNYFAEKHGVTN